MFQLKLFVHQRLHAAAEDILGQVEKAIVLALSEAEGARSKDLAEGLLHQLSPPAKETGLLRCYQLLFTELSLLLIMAKENLLKH